MFTEQDSAMDAIWILIKPRILALQACKTRCWLSFLMELMLMPSVLPNIIPLRWANYQTDHSQGVFLRMPLFCSFLSLEDANAMPCKFYLQDRKRTHLWGKMSETHGLLTTASHWEKKKQTGPGFSSLNQGGGVFQLSQKIGCHIDWLVQKVLWLWCSVKRWGAVCTPQSYIWSQLIWKHMSCLEFGPECQIITITTLLQHNILRNRNESINEFPEDGNNIQYLS